ncbi:MULTISPECIES: type VI secretion system contractile sheath small subunit [Acinetobacter]|uniref:type VI secretion system contractile sheath small subunit n=1 Tax=Acinetobacter TaxID=469 RepID=UPI000552AAB8|nr:MULTISPECIES: type VI secretion system contractile sheath small subunit [Acinetobacter]MCO8083125.1 type VI secretion system contractile sheath small subunit [Acinetobacter lwoffii]MDT0200016.1 type VI secretion system contractile sheath small subunit [Acinetobacter sp. RG5]MDT0231450.1 type VI secretion system contractile sheath small subunit [Acinetobacter sp. RRD8]RDC53860.1 type VI secretion system contractile sheath small subunit [Acinetobacter sp. RIT592]
MAKRESVQKKLQRIRPPRVQLTYDVEVGDGREIKELPFVVGVLGDFSAASELEKTKLKDKKFINVDLGNIDEVMQSLAPRASFQVENSLTEESGTISVDLVFNAMDDFRPEQVVQQVEPLRKLVEARERLTDLRNKISNNERLEGLLDDILKNTDQIRKMSMEADNESL